MNRNDKCNGKGSNNNSPRSKRSKRNNNRRPKEVELNVDRSDINSADMRVSKKGKGFKVESEENDLGWYNHYPELVEDVANLSFSRPLGTKIPYDHKLGTVSHAINTIPGICVYEFTPTIGQASGVATDAINVASNKQYVFIRRNLSTYANYDAPDLTLFELAMDSIFLLYGSAARAYGVLQNWKVFNRYFAAAVITAMGYDYDDLSENMADFRAGLNQIAFKLSQFCVPSGMDYITRHIWMTSNLFYDSETVKAQTYLFRPAAYYKFTEVTEGPSYLAYTPINYGSPLTAKQILGILNNCISAIMNSQDCIAMSGDISRAFGFDNVFSVKPIAEEYMIEPIYSKEVLAQLENAVIFGNIMNNEVLSANITQQTNLGAGPNVRQILYATRGVTDAAYSAMNARLENKILNFHTNDISPQFVMEATRLMCIPTNIGKYPLTGQATNTTAYYEKLGTEVVNAITFYYYDIDGNLLSNTVNDYCLEPSTVSSATAFAQLWSTFDWCAPLYFMSPSGSGETAGGSVSVLLDVDNYTVLDQSDLGAIHDTALLSLMMNPYIDKMSEKPIH